MVIILLYSQAFSQEQVNLNDELLIEYNVEYRPYIDRDFKWKYLFNLYINEGRSIFANDKMMPLYEDNPGDAVFRKVSSGYMFSSAFNTIIIEKNQKDIIQKQLVIDRVFLGYKDKKMIPNDWTISSDTATIRGFLSQKATCTLGGRDWEAWFTPEIAINEGPYKFSGLPGLILKAESVDGDYSFVFKSIQNVAPDSYHFDNFEYKLVSKKKYKSKFKSLDQDPIKTRQSSTSNTYSIRFDDVDEETMHASFKEQAARDNKIDKEP